MLTTTVAGRTWNFSHAIGRGAAAGAGFANPYDMAFGPEGSIYVLNRGTERVGQGVTLGENKRIGVVTMDQQFLGDFAKKDFMWPVGLAIDEDGNAYCSDEYDNLIIIYDSDGQRLGQWGEAGSGEGQFLNPAGIQFDADGNLIVVDSRNDRVQKYTRDGKYLSSFGESGSGEGQLRRPWGLTIDKDGAIYVADFGNDRVVKFSAGGEQLLTFGTSAEEGGDLSHPSDVAVDSEGDVYVVDFGNNRVQIYDPEGDVITALYGDATEWSNWAREVVEANPDVVKAYRRLKDMSPVGRFARPVSILVDAEDRVIISETIRNRLQVYIKEKDYMDPQFNL